MSSTTGSGARHRRAGAPKQSGFGFGVLVLLGLILLAAGVVGLLYTAFATLTTMVLFAWLLLVGGIVGLIQAIQSRREPGAFWLTLAVAAVNIAAGIVLLRRPDVAASALTLFVALLLLTAGLFRVVGGIASMSARMTWTVVVGVIDIVLGLLVLAEWPSNSRYVIGTFISLALLFDGLSMVSLGITGRRIVDMVRTEDARMAHGTAITGVGAGAAAAGAGAGVQEGAPAGASAGAQGSAQGGAPAERPPDAEIEEESEELAGGAAWRDGPGETDGGDPSTAEWTADKGPDTLRKSFGAGPDDETGGRHRR
ncbi:hypothetical protein GCM10023205_16950 [Yinghuangia aomiensis]|uniref:HdeD family acid-resistance protein n=1 Tax=Yinghuangia aomiensis TaxID=676205 RepID=A0ABP9GXB8_9ACTN